MLDPLVRSLETRPKRGAWLPTKAILDHRVVAVTAPNALGRRKVVLSIKLHPGNVFEDVDESIDRDQFGASEVDGLGDVAVHDPLGALHAVVDVHEAA